MQSEKINKSGNYITDSRFDGEAGLCRQLSLLLIMEKDANSSLKPPEGHSAFKNSSERHVHLSEQYFTVRSAAKALGLKYHALLRAVNAGLIPSYQPFGKRRLVLLPEIRAYVASCQTGGQGK